MATYRKHLIPAVVALAYVGLAAAHGGHSASVVAGITIAIWWAVLVGLFARAWPGRDVPGRGVVAGVALAGLAALAFLSMAWANDPGLAFTEGIRVCGYLGLFVLVVLGSGNTGPRPWLIGLALGVVAVAVMSLGVRFLPGLFADVERELAEDLPAAQGRLSYPIDYWNGLAACMALGVPLLLWLGAQARSRLGRAAAVAGLALPLLTIYLSSSRGGFAAAAVGVIVMLVLGPARVSLLVGTALGGIAGAVLMFLASERPQMLNAFATIGGEREGAEMLALTVVVALAAAAVRYLADPHLERIEIPRVAWRVGAGLAAIALVVVVAASDPVTRLDDFFSTSEAEAQGGISGTRDLTSTEGSGRGEYWGAALDAYADNPVGGLGAGNWELYWNANATLGRTVEDAHSLYLEKLAELGPAGLVLLLVFLGSAVVGIRRVTAAPPVARIGAAREPGGPFGGGEAQVLVAVIAVGALSAALEWTWELPVAFGPVVVAVALLTGPAMRPGGASRRPSGQFGLGVATIAAGWLAVCAAGLSLVAEVKLNDSREAAAAGEFPAAAQDARDAAAVQPWSPEPQLQLALVEERAGELDRARDALGETLERTRADWRPWFVVARVEAADGNIPAAVSALRIARALSAEPERLVIEGVSG